MGISHSKARKIHERERGNNWIPIGAAGVSTAAPATEPQTQDRDLRALSALKVRVREALSIAHWGEPYTAFERQMARLQLHGLDLGTKYRSHHLVQIVEHLAAVAARARTKDALIRNLDSVGVAKRENWRKMPSSRRKLQRRRNKTKMIGSSQPRRAETIQCRN